MKETKEFLRHIFRMVIIFVLILFFNGLVSIFFVIIGWDHIYTFEYNLRTLTLLIIVFLLYIQIIKFEKHIKKK